MAGDGSRNMNYWIDFYSSEHDKDLTIEADLIDYGEAQEQGDWVDILKDPEFRIDTVCDYEDVAYELSQEEERRVKEILTNIYWNQTT